jgi:hypothetical protein
LAACDAPNQIRLASRGADVPTRRGKQNTLGYTHTLLSLSARV